jgi:hypothetical protein
MTTETRKAFAFAALIAATGILGLGPTYSAAQAQSDNSAYEIARINTAFEVIAGMRPAAEVRVPMATKGDLPVPLGCIGMQADAQAECMDVAYEVPTEPSIVIETRFGTTSTLMRMDAMTVADVPKEEPRQQSE